MKSKIFSFLLAIIIILAVSCKSNQKVDTTQTQSSTQTTASRDTFDPASITQQQYSSTMEEVRQFIEELNRIIQRRNFAAWQSALSSDYLAEISSPENLQRISEQPAMKTRRIILRNAEDYFIHVVVPSRANSRVDEIEFIGRNRVKAFTISTNRAGEEQRLRLYDLEKIGNSWKIIN